jgi:acyl carrier protein
MFESLDETLVTRVTDVVQRTLVERSIRRMVSPEEDLREVGLSSLDMVNLVLSIESEFDLTIDENEITPRNFRSISAISRLMASLTVP